MKRCLDTHYYDLTTIFYYKQDTYWIGEEFENEGRDGGDDANEDIDAGERDKRRTRNFKAVRPNVHKRSDGPTVEQTKWHRN